MPNRILELAEFDRQRRLRADAIHDVRIEKRRRSHRGIIRKLQEIGKVGVDSIAIDHDSHK